MSLTSDAYELSEVLMHVVDCLDKYAIQQPNDYVQNLADAIRALTKDYERSIKVEKSRTLAQEVLRSIAEPMLQINGAASHMPIFPENDDSLDNYLRLYTIFRETRYSEDTLG